jgi:DNA-binding FrmR family transcriptional regulator
MGGGKGETARVVGVVEANVKDSENALRRLKTVEGHLRGVIRMVEEDIYCIDVIRQIQAIEDALNKDSTQILENHLDSCVTTAIQGSNPKERERVLSEIVDVFEMAQKI